MSALSRIGSGAWVLASGALATLAVVKARDDKYIYGIWQALAALPGGEGVFAPELVQDLPDPAQRYFLHAIRPGVPLATRLHWRYTGAMKPGKDAPEMALRADQIIVAGRGFVWKTVAQNGALVMTGADHYFDGAARMRIYLYDLIPIVNAAGPEVTRSSLGRLLVECIAIPSALLPGPNVRIEAVDAAHFRAVLTVGADVTALTIRVDETGRVQELAMPRWGNQTDDGHYELIPYGAIIEDERTFGGYTIPSRMRVFWWYGTDRQQEQIRLAVDTAQLD
jgi:hypothetical protein